MTERDYTKKTTVTAELVNHEAQAFAELLNRLQWSQLMECAEDDADFAHDMAEGLLCVLAGLEAAGFNARRLQGDTEDDYE